MSMRDLDPKEKRKVRPEPNDELQKIHIRAVAKKFTFSRQGLPEDMKVELASLLRTNLDLFSNGHPRICSE